MTIKERLLYIKNNLLKETSRDNVHAKEIYSSLKEDYYSKIESGIKPECAIGVYIINTFKIDPDIILLLQKMGEEDGLVIEANIVGDMTAFTCSLPIIDYSQRVISKKGLKIPS